MANIYGTPIYIHSADDPQNRTKNEPMSSRIKDILKTMQPLEKVSEHLAQASQLLDSTGYSDLKSGIDQLKNQIDEQVNSIVSQLTNQNKAPQQSSTLSSPAQNNPMQHVPQSSVPTAGQISGKEPLPTE